MVTKLKYIIPFILLILIVSAIYFLFNPLKFHFFPKCPFYMLTGLYCPGCGSQRALHSLLHFHLAETFSYNFLFIPALLVLLYHSCIKILNTYTPTKRQSVFYTPTFPVLLFIIVMLFWILRNIPFYPFSYLAP